MGLREKLPGIRSERRTVRWVSYIGYLFLAMIVIGALAPSNQSTSSTSTTDSTNGLIEKPATDLVIQGQDLPTTWEYEQIQGGDVNASRSASLVDADLRTAYTIENSITVYNSTEKAKSRYQSKIKSIKEDRGYKKISRTLGKSSFGTSSFAYRPAQTRRLNYIYFYEDNVFVKLSLASSSMVNAERGALFEAAKAIDKKIG